MQMSLIGGQQSEKRMMRQYKNHRLLSASVCSVVKIPYGPVAIRAERSSGAIVI